MFFIAILIIKDFSKATSFSTLFVVFVGLICWLKNRAMYALPSDYAWILDTTYDWETNRAFVFSFVVGMMILIAVFWLLMDKKRN